MEEVQHGSRPITQEASAGAAEGMAGGGTGGKETATLPVVHREGSTEALPGDIRFIATNPSELATAHREMIVWARQQMVAVDAQRAEEQANLDIAAQKHWATAPFKKRIRSLERRREFLEKVEAALQKGYVIIPNFAMNIFAIRTAARSPRGGMKDNRGYPDRHFPQSAQMLPQGVGEYVDPNVRVHEERRVEKADDGSSKTMYLTWPAEDFDGITFPMIIAKPEMMSRAAEAVAGKLFDELGVAQDSSSNGRRGDPILIGRVRNPNANRPDVSFFLGWYLDPSTL